MRAKYRGFCRWGGHAIMPGEEIGRDGYGGWAHGPCLMSKPDPGPRKPRRTSSGAALARDLRRVDSGSRFDDWEAIEARRERERDNAEYAAGIEDARRYRDEVAMMGREWADANEWARDMRGLNGDW